MNELASTYAGMIVWLSPHWRTESAEQLLAIMPPTLTVRPGGIEILGTTIPGFEQAFRDVWPPDDSTAADAGDGAAHEEQ